MSSSARRMRRRTMQPVAFDPAVMDASEAAVIAAKASGCRCKLEVVVRSGKLIVRHDSWCPLLRRGDVN